MKIGVADYPEHWDRSLWEQDADLMKETGVKLVRLAEFAWCRLEPREGEYDFSFLDTILDKVYAAGGIRVDIDAKLREGMSPLPRFGFVMQMPEGNERLRYFGRGPVESYRDKRHASRQGLFETTVTDHFEHYVRPQENMAHADTRWMMVSSVAGQGLLAVTTGKDFSFNCAHFTPAQLTDTAHDYELVPMKETCVNLDTMQSGVGSNSCGPVLIDKYRFNDENIDFTIRIVPEIKK